MKPVAVRKPVPLRDPVRVVTRAEIHSHVTAGPQGAGTVAVYRFRPQCVLLPSWSPGTLTPQTAPPGSPVSPAPPSEATGLPLGRLATEAYRTLIRFGPQSPSPWRVWRVTWEPCPSVFCP